MPFLHTLQRSVPSLNCPAPNKIQSAEKICSRVHFNLSPHRSLPSRTISSNRSGDKGSSAKKCLALSFRLKSVSFETLSHGEPRFWDQWAMLLFLSTFFCLGRPPLLLSLSLLHLIHPRSPPPSPLLSPPFHQLSPHCHSLALCELNGQSHSLCFHSTLFLVEHIVFTFFPVTFTLTVIFCYF